MFHRGNASRSAARVGLYLAAALALAFMFGGLIQTVAEWLAGV